jgi:hypothetical protein
MSIAAVEAEPMIQSVRFENGRLVVELSDGRTIGTPVSWYPRLDRAAEAQRAHWRLIGRGEGIHWPELDEDLSLAGMLAGRSAPGGRR